MDDVVKATTSLGIKNIFPGRLEADDVISWLTENIEGKKVIISVDRDFIQLVKSDVCYYNPIKKVLINIDNFVEHFDLTPKEYLYFKAIVGDVSDNIPGVEGFGKVRGHKLAKSFCENDENVIAPYREQVETNLKLMDLAYGIRQYPEESALYKEQLESLSKTSTQFETFKEICTENEFNSILNKFNDWQRSFNQKNTTELLTEYFKVFA